MTQHHINFYRKYRSQTFDQVVGQAHIIQTLSNALTHDRLAHAYIFSGPRGTGKTSTARILSKSLNCRSGKSLTPCLTCDLCSKISASQSVDVIEIDAASNTGVDNIRTLNDQIHFKPVECLYKVYIIDEAHMLSTGAFNALLKTIEEPPAFTLFILATTEPHKIPATIHSRCQQLNFRKLSLTDIISQLSSISTSESITISQNGLAVIARQSDGCMRDAVTLLDQVYSFKGNTISDDDIHFILGTHTTDGMIDIVTGLIKNNSGKVLTELQHLLDSGLNTTQFIHDLLQLIKQLIMIHHKLPISALVDSRHESRLTQLATETSLPFLHHCLEIVSQLISDTRGLVQAELAIQVRLLEILGRHELQSSKKSRALSKEQHVPSTPPALSIDQAKPVSVSPPQMAPPPSPPKDMPTAPTSQSVSNTSYSNAWAGFLDTLKSKRYSLYTILNNATFKTVTDTHVVVQLAQSFKFFIEKLNEPDNQTLISEIIKTHFNRPLKLSTSDQVTTHPSTPTSQSATPSTQADSSNKPLNDIIHLFDGSLV